MKSRFDPLRAAPAAVSALAALALLILAACGSAPLTRPPAPTAAADRPSRWQAPLPHHGEVSELHTWWRQFDDPVLVHLIDAAQSASPTIASAAARIEQSRATRVRAGGALMPSLDARASAVRGRPDALSGLADSASAGLQATWEIDLFGSGRAARDATLARFEAAKAGWHDARVAVAAEAAVNYTNLRACEAQVRQTRLDLASRIETVRLTRASTRAGFESPANADLACAGAAEGNSLLTQRRAQCEVLVKGLVAMTGIEEPLLRAQMAAGAGRLPRPASIAVASVPAQALAQRPDLVAAERELIAAGAEVAQAQAARFPRVVLNGNISASRSGPSDFGSQRGPLWSIGPVAVVLPLFDGGVRRANVGAAEARLAQADAVYRGKLRNAVREVEEALIALQSTDDRSADAQIATRGHAASFHATEARFKSGLASLYELENARRFALQAETALIDLKRERAIAWISLYRALGGGWSDTPIPVAVG